MILTPDRVILTLDRVDIRATEVEASLFERIYQANKEDPLYQEYRDAVAKGVPKLYGVKLEQCRVVDGVLFKRGLLWVPEGFHTELLKEVHN